MQRKLTVLFRRDPSGDKRKETVAYEGYKLYWPDGRPVGVGVNAFCYHGQRLLGLGRHLAGRAEKLINLIVYHLDGLEDPLTRVPGCRVRRFFLQRTGSEGRLHFMDGTPTAVVFNLEEDEPSVLYWIDLPSLDDGQRQWIDLCAQPA